MHSTPVSPASPIAPTPAVDAVGVARNVMAFNDDGLEDFSYAQNIIYDALNHLKHAEAAIDHLRNTNADVEPLVASVQNAVEQFNNVAEEIYHQDRRSVLGKKQAQFRSTDSYRQKYQTALDVYYSDHADEAYGMMREIVAADLAKDDPELHACALESMTLIQQANLLNPDHHGQMERAHVSS